jgi:hypothetical protein
MSSSSSASSSDDDAPRADARRDIIARAHVANYYDSLAEEQGGVCALTGADLDDYLDYRHARLTKSMHNGRWLLCWPPGFVRFTAPNGYDPRRWNVTVLAGRINGSASSKPVERVWPGGYTELLRPYVAGGPNLVVERGVVREPSPGNEDLGLFNEEG